MYSVGDPDRELDRKLGECILRSHTVLAWALHEWCAGPNGQRSLDAIAFDKLGAASLTVWNRLADQDEGSHAPDLR